jgi:hypothetical protein
MKDKTEVDVIKEVNLFVQSCKVQFGWEKRITDNQYVGTNKIMCRIVVPKDSGDYPDIWFPVISNNSSITKLTKEVEGLFIPDWMRADCFEYAYHLLKNKSL